MRGLNEHVKKHTNQQSPARFHCDSCSKKYRALKTLRAHQKLKHASNGKVYQCQHCDASFQIKGNYRRHLNKSHTAAREVEFICFMCRATCATKENLARHLKAHLKDASDGSSDENYNPDEDYGSSDASDGSSSVPVSPRTPLIPGSASPQPLSLEVPGEILNPFNFAPHPPISPLPASPVSHSPSVFVDEHEHFVDEPSVFVDAPSVLVTDSDMDGNSGSSSDEDSFWDMNVSDLIK